MKIDNKNSNVEDNPKVKKVSKDHLVVVPNSHWIVRKDGIWFNLFLKPLPPVSYKVENQIAKTYYYCFDQYFKYSGINETQKKELVKFYSGNFYCFKCQKLSFTEMKKYGLVRSFNN